MPTLLCGRLVAGCMLLVAAFLSMIACGAGPAAEDGATKGPASTEGTMREATGSPVAQCSGPDKYTLEADARAYARDEGISVDEARRRLRLQHCFADDLADLESALRNEEAGTFAGLWIQNQPQYRFVVLFTRDGERTIRPYLKEEPERFRRLVEVRLGADASAAELAAARDKASRLVDELDVRTEGLATNVKKNRAEIYVTDETRFEAALRKEGVRLPERVEVVEIEGQMRPG